MLNFSPSKEINLRDYQTEAIEALRDGIRQKRKRQVLVAPTGAGKTVCASHLLREAHRKDNYALFVVDRVALVDQTSATLDSYGIPHGVVQGSNHPRWAPNENIQVCSIQTLKSRTLPRDPSLLIYDEAHCFVAGTLVATPSGPRKIEEIEEGDAVYNAVGIGYVRHSFYHDADDLVRVSFDDGTEIECTADHRFFTGDSWVQARFLDGHCAFGIEAMPDLWEHLSSADYADCPWELVGGSKEVLDEKEVLLADLCKEIEEPNAQPDSAQEDGGNIAQNTAYADADRWVRARSDRAAASVIAGAWRRLAARIDGKDRCEARQWNTEPLEDRHSKSAADDCNRSGRRQPQRSECPQQGSAQGPVLSVKRVVSVQGVECKGGRSVYNLHVSGHPSFFANGVLVHNCLYKSTLDFMSERPDMVAIGLTATPFTPGMGEHWNGLVNVTTTRKLIESGFLIEPKIYVGRAPDDSEFTLKGDGEFSDRSAESAGIKIIGDVVGEWIKKTHEHFGGPVKTIVFAPTVDYGKELCDAFAAAGYTFQQISYHDKDDAERRQKLDEFRSPESMTHGLVSCGVLTKGFDQADVMCGISCRPYRKSLSSHMQEIGRVMRPIIGGDKKAIWLDHSGNVERFAVDMFDVWDNGAGDLSQAAKRDSTPRERQSDQREKPVCPECSGALRGSACICCGWERPARSGIVTVEGDLQAFDQASIGMKANDRLRADCLSDPRKVWEAALTYTHERSTKGGDHAIRWAKAIFHGIYPNDWPARTWGATLPDRADQSAYALIEREQKRYRKNARRAA